MSTVLALPEDSENWSSYDIVFATSRGTIRKNKLEDFLNIRSSGKIAMKMDNGEKLIGVALCRDDQDIMVSSRLGKCVRFPVSEVRVFNSHNSVGVRAIKLRESDEVISLAILNNGAFSVEERDDYVRYANWLRRSKEEILMDQQLEPPAKYEEMKAMEQMLLTVTEYGFAKRTSSFEYRTCGRGAQGVKNIEISDKNGAVVAVFPINDEDDIMLVTDTGKLIRCPVNDIRVTGRAAQGVILFRLNKNEKVVSAVRLIDNK